MPPGETETIMLEEIVGRMRCAVATQIRWRRTQDPGSHRNLARDHPRIIGEAEPKNRRIVQSGSLLGGQMPEVVGSFDGRLARPRLFVQSPSFLFKTG
jgi:hypothetical protein